MSAMMMYHDCGGDASRLRWVEKEKVKIRKLKVVGNTQRVV
jgi:hypothetical protein